MRKKLNYNKNPSRNPRNIRRKRALARLLKVVNPNDRVKQEIVSLQSKIVQ